MKFEELVEQAQKIYTDADASKVNEHVAIQFNITGEGEGAFYLEIADGKVNVQPYEYYDRDVLVTTTANVLVDIVTGKLGIEKAYLTGKLHAEGNLGKALLLKKIELKKTEEKKPARKTEAKKTLEKKTAEKKTVEKKAPVKKETAGKSTVKKSTGK